jgi:YVTN family beta-propeller protein
VIGTASNTVVTTIMVGLKPIAVAITPDGTQVYVANKGANTVSVIARPGNTVVTTVPVESNPDAIAVTPDGKNAYVANRTSANVSVIRTVTNTVVPLPIAVGNLPFAVGIVAQ